MDALSSKTFQPIQPDGFVLSSLGKETPKIEITGTESLCQDPLSPTACDVPLCEWDDLHHHGNNGVPADCLVEQSGSHHHSSDASDHRRGSLSRRSEGGPGKCPSPSRNSPRRHSPVPYSPKRQNRARSSASSVASEEFPDIALSPRRHSPVPSSPQAERPSSLSLASGAPAEEFICVSYTDPFCSPTITHTSEAILAISINCNHDGDQDVDMIPQDSRGGDSGSGVVEGADVSSPPLPPPPLPPSLPTTTIIPSATGTSGSDSDSHSLLCEDSVQGSSSKSQAAENGRDMTDMSIEAEERNSLRMGSGKSGVGHYQSAVASGSGVNVMGCQLGRQQWVKSADSKCNRQETGEERDVEFMESEDDLHVDEVTDSDSSSDDEMLDFVSPPNPYDMCETMNYSPSAHAMSDCRNNNNNNNPLAQCSSSLTNCSQPQTKEALHSSCVSGCQNSKRANETANIACTSLDSIENMQTAAIDVERHQNSTEHSAAQSLPKELDHPPSCSVTGSSWAARRASFPDHHQSRMPSLSACSSKEASPRRSLSHHVSKTPDDFALCCVVGSPPLTFPHCQHAVLVHCSLPSPYDPDLPTPPIVLTPHTSYEDLNFDPGAGCSAAASGVQMTLHKGSSSGDASVQNPSICRSRSFPKLNRSEEQFQEPDQPWPVLGCRSSEDLNEEEEERGGGGGRGEPNKRQWENRRSSDSSYGCGEVSDMGDCSIAAAAAAATTSVSLPGSPSNSRQAVIGRLRRVVERRLSGTSDTLEDALLLQGGGGGGGSP